MNCHGLDIESCEPWARFGGNLAVHMAPPGASIAVGSSEQAEPPEFRAAVLYFHHGGRDKENK